MKWLHDKLHSGEQWWQLKVNKDDVYTIVHCSDPHIDKAYTISGYYWSNGMCYFVNNSYRYRTLKEAKDAVMYHVVERELKR